MTLDPLSDMAAALHLHLWSALAALLIGPFAIYRQRHDRLHKVLGYLWVAAIGLAALSSFALPAAILHFAAGFGIIHLLAIWVLLQLTLGLRDARRGRIQAHRARMAGLYWQGLTVAGLLTLLPGRRLNEMLFAADPLNGLWVVAGFGAALVLLNLRLSLHVPSAPESSRKLR